MLAFGPRSGGVRGFDLYAGDVFEVHSRPFLVTCPNDSGRGPLFVVGEDGRSCSLAEYEGGLRASGVVPQAVRHVGAWGAGCNRRV